MDRNSSRGPLSFGLLLSALALGTSLAFASGAAAQQLTVSESPRSAESPGHIATPPVIVERVEKPEIPVHRFWDRNNVLLFSGVSVFRGLDYASTRNMQARGREEILLPDDVVNNSAGFAGVEAAASATSIGLSYWMHRAGHHKIERWISIAHISVTGFGAARNYALKSKHPPGVR
ncbi:MAG: hypothetical protein DMG88_09175 [Acidobacteria bacterium]|nr:MAG: hypothetical protein DMG88_09175 [Acidobacteriota bacterium]